MKADLVRRQKEFQSWWDEIDLYGAIRKLRKGAPKFILHDGPPYANGNIHVGTGQNKILKDVVVRYKTMQGCDAPFVPGWDCHGQPIEHKVAQELGPKMRTMSKDDIRRRCRAYAEHFVDVQRMQFRSMGVLADWDNPYLTFAPGYEAGVMKVFGKLYEEGYVYRGLKPIHWCLNCRTALAEAELEYADLSSPSIYVKFELSGDVAEVIGVKPEEKPSILIWTTTPWTLPANLAVAVNPFAQYVVMRSRRLDGTLDVLVVAKDLRETVAKACRLSAVEIVRTLEGKHLTKLAYRHPFMERTSPVLPADFVSLEDGTGVVHIAPGHGEEDYQVGGQFKLDILSPVGPDGVFTAEAGPYDGLQVFEADARIMDDLRASGHLLASQMVSHSYPHCWRCKQPVIFRSTEQWFVNVDHKDLRQRALEEVEKVTWYPKWGATRISSMLRERPDWCISRQRSWGVPIPAFYCCECGQVVTSGAIIDHVADIFAREGADAWFRRDASELVPPGTACACGCRDLRKESDILDVWFESGSSFLSVVTARDELQFPSDLYLEGTDQHRGWFQLSLIPAVGVVGRSPFKAVLTHGFVVDEKGQKMSKSLGNLIEVDEVVKTLGADLMRLWIASIDAKNDINVSMHIIGALADPYRRIRNTFRFLLGNLEDFDPAADMVAYDEMVEVDRWALMVTERLIEEVTSSLDEYALHRATARLHNFCVVEMSSLYLDVLKDRLYTFARDSRQRRSSQSALWRIAGTLARLLAPILVHTSEEVWQLLREKDPSLPESVHLADFPQRDSALYSEELEARWQRLLLVRSDVMRRLEFLRASGTIGSALEAAVHLATEDDELYAVLSYFGADLASVFIVSEATIEKGAPDDWDHGQDEPKLRLRVAKEEHRKCARCWNYRPSVGEVKEYPDICRRCASVVEALK